jgi:hypothetical protein
MEVHSKYQNASEPSRIFRLFQHEGSLARPFGADLGVF